MTKIDVIKGTFDLVLTLTNKLKLEIYIASPVTRLMIFRLIPTTTIAYTENFISFDNPRSYAVYVGVIPIDYSSGTSIKGRKRISHIANKELKQELNQAARCALEWDKE